MERATASGRTSEIWRQRRPPMEYRGRIRVRKGGPRNVSVELFGELAAAADSLRKILAWASDLDAPSPFNAS